MPFLKSALAKGGLLAAIVGGALVATASSASADVACNGSGECWHVRDRTAYPAGVGIYFHNDDWAARHRHDGRWRWRHDRADRGYYRNGVWIAF